MKKLKLQYAITPLADDLSEGKALLISRQMRTGVQEKTHTSINVTRLDDDREVTSSYYTEGSEESKDEVEESEDEEELEKSRYEARKASKNRMRLNLFGATSP